MGKPTERVLPHDIDAERAMLGAIIVNPKAADGVPSSFVAADFFRDAHRLIYRAIVALRAREAPIDLITLSDELNRRRDLDAVGGRAYIAALTDAVPRSAHAEGYARVVADHAARRRVIHHATVLAERAYCQADIPADLVADAQKGVTELAQGVMGDVRLARVGKFLPAFMEKVDATAGGNPLLVGIATGYRDLDEMTGGFQRQDLILVAARPGQGKTALLLNIADRMSQRGRIVAMFSLEMSRHQLIMRLVCSKARIDSYQLRNGFLSQASYDRLAAAHVELSEQTFAIDDTAEVPVEDIVAAARRLRAEEGTLDVVMVDYLQLLGTRGRYESRQQQVAAISRGLKRAAKELDVAVVAAAQLSRAVDERKSKRPILSDLKESGSLEQDADVIIFPYRPNDEEPATELIIAKQRNGPTGVVKVNFMKQYTTFDELDEREERARAV